MVQYRTYWPGGSRSGTPTPGRGLPRRVHESTVSYDPCGCGLSRDHAVPRQASPPFAERAHHPRPRVPRSGTTDRQCPEGDRVLATEQPLALAGEPAGSSRVPGGTELVRRKTVIHPVCLPVFTGLLVPTAREAETNDTMRQGLSRAAGQTAPILQSDHFSPHRPSRATV
jgi:hypothetical protein